MAQSISKSTLPRHEAVTSILNTMLANLIGEESRLHEMAEDRITPADLKDYPFQARVLEILEYLEKENRPPTAESIKSVLLVAGQEEFAGYIPLLLEKQTEHKDIISHAFALKKIYLLQQQNDKLLDELASIFHSNVGVPSEHLQQALEKVQQAQVRVEQKASLDHVATVNRFLAKVRKRIERRATGISSAPTWPWEGMKRLSPQMERGDITTLMAKSGWGKTTVGGVLAEHWAFAQKYEVYVYLLETTPDQFHMRQTARNCLIPTKAIRTALWNPDEESNATAAYRDFVHNTLDNPELGKIYLQDTASWTPAMFEAFITGVERKAAGEGKECVHIVDYYSLVDTSQWKYSNVPNNELATWFKRIAVSKELYLFLLAQEQEESQVGAGDNKFAKGGNEILKQSQAVFRLDRSVASNEMPVLDANGRQRVDNMGNPRYYHRPGQLNSIFRIDSIKVNDGELGSVQLQSEMAYYRIHEAAS